MKRLIASLTAASLALSLAACGGAASSSAAANNGGAASSTPAASSAKPTTVTVWHLQPEDSEETCMHQRLLRWAESSTPKTPTTSPLRSPAPSPWTLS